MASDISITELHANIARHGERLSSLEKWESEYRDVVNCMHKTNANVELLTQRVKENSDVIKAEVSKQSEQNRELRLYVDKAIKEINSETDSRFKAHSELINNLLKKPGERAERGWEHIKGAALTAVVSVLITAIVTYLLINLGPY